MRTAERKPSIASFLLIPLLAGVFFYFGITLLTFYNEGALRACNTGIALCFNGLFESVFLFPLIIATSLFGMRYFYRKKRVMNAGFSLVFGFLMLLFLWAYLFFNNVWRREYILILFPTIFGTLSFLLATKRKANQ